jgi:hypothetical protein
LKTRDGSEGLDLLENKRTNIKSSASIAQAALNERNQDVDARGEIRDDTIKTRSNRINADGLHLQTASRSNNDERNLIKHDSGDGRRGKGIG